MHLIRHRDRAVVVVHRALSGSTSHAQHPFQRLHSSLASPRARPSPPPAQTAPPRGSTLATRLTACSRPSRTRRPAGNAAGARARPCPRLACHTCSAGRRAHMCTRVQCDAAVVAQRAIESRVVTPWSGCVMSRTAVCMRRAAIGERFETFDFRTSDVALMNSRSNVTTCHRWRALRLMAEESTIQTTFHMPAYIFAQAPPYVSDHSMYFAP